MLVKPSQRLSKRGLESFRARETAALEAVTASATVIATGGGIILAEYNRQFLREKRDCDLPLCAGVTLVGRLEAFPEGAAPDVDRKTDKRRGQRRVG